MRQLPPKRRVPVRLKQKDSKGYYLDLPIEQQARRIARAAGHVGSNAAYLHNTIVKLMEHGIHDSYLWRPQELVAAEIRAMRPGLGRQPSETSPLA